MIFSLEDINWLTFDRCPEGWVLVEYHVSVLWLSIVIMYSTWSDHCSHTYRNLIWDIVDAYKLFMVISRIRVPDICSWFMGVPIRSWTSLVSCHESYVADTLKVTRNTGAEQSDTDYTFTFVVQWFVCVLFARQSMLPWWYWWI